jgi:Ca2+-binding EF-hand superfamily protein
LTKFVNDGLGPLLTITRKQRLEQTVRLLDVLDRDEDGVISVEEVVTAPSALHQFDFDDDEALSVAELQPFPNSIRQAKVQNSASDTGGDSVAVEVSTDGEIDAAMIRFKDAYNLGDAGGLELARCGLTGSASEYDQNHNGNLEQPEIREWLARSAPDVTLDIQFRNNLPAKAKAPLPETPRLRSSDQKSARAWNVLLDGTPLSITGDDNRRLSRDSLSFAKINFRRSDADKNGYLGPEEFGNLQFGVPFDAVDANHDNMLMIDELETYAKTQAQLSQTRIILTIGDDVRTLFQLMDADSNRFLTPRELASLGERLKPYDHNGNGKFDRADFVSDYKLTFAFSVPDNLKDTSTGNPQMMASGGPGRLPRSRTGPVWFQKMDRNRDKDVSWREFLGPRAAFDKLDANHDGLIDHTEADAAEPAAKETQVSTGS